MNLIAKNLVTGLVAAFCFFGVSFESQPVSAGPSGSSVASDSISVGGAVIQVTFESGEISLPRAQHANWVRKSGCAVNEYYGFFPVPKVEVKIVPVTGGEGVVFGRTVMIGEIPQITVTISEFANDSSLRDDWIMTHEMVHLAFPSVSEDHHWIEEGIATYVERIAAPRSVTSHRRKSGAISWMVFRKDYLPPAIGAWITLTPGDEHIGVAHCSACWRMIKFTDAPTTDTGSKTRCEASFAPVAT
jgi:hypothetical protein